MHRFLAAALVFTVLGFTAAAADDAPKPPDAPPATAVTKGKLLPHFRSLGLSAEQKTKVETITGAAVAKIHDLEAQIAAVRDKEKADCLAVLTPEQKKNLDALLTGSPTK